MIKYGLREKSTGKMAGFSTDSNEGASDCVSPSYRLNFYDEEHLWLVDSAKRAAYVLHYPTPWYNAGYETPNHSFKSDEVEVEVVKFITQVEPVEVDVLTQEQYLRKKYSGRESDRAHRDHLLKVIEEGRGLNISIYEFLEFERLGG